MAPSSVLPLDVLARRVFGPGAVIGDQPNQSWVIHSGGEAFAARSRSELRAALEARLMKEAGLIDAAEVGRITNRTGTHISYYVNHRGLPFVSRGKNKAYLFDRAAVVAWAAANPVNHKFGRQPGTRVVNGREIRPGAKAPRQQRIGIRRMGGKAVAPRVINGQLAVQIGPEAQRRLMKEYETVKQFGVSYGAFIVRLLELGLERR